MNQNDWLSFEEFPPADGHDIIALYRGAGVAMVHYLEDQKQHYTFTHWMPFVLPKKIDPVEAAFIQRFPECTHKNSPATWLGFSEGWRLALAWQKEQGNE